MSPKFRNRLVLLLISVIVMLILFAMNMIRSDESRLPATPTINRTPSASQSIVADPLFPTRTSVGNNETPKETEVPTAIAEAPTDTAASTATAQAMINATAEAGMVRATQRAREMSNTIRVLYQDGVISGIEGSYKKIEDFSANFNRSGYYEMHFSDYEAKYFVLRTNLIWDNAGEEVSYPTAGCGLAFGYLDRDNHYRVFLNLDGNIRLHRMLDGAFTLASIDYSGPLKQPAGHANMILAVDRGWVTVYIDNQQITRYYDETIREGRLAYTIAAGTSINFGTSCTFKDIELWIIE